jgi:hypothetical protein
MPIAPAYYLNRARELDALADKAAERSLRASYVELAQSFREMAELARACLPAEDESGRDAPPLAAKSNDRL